MASHPQDATRLPIGEIARRTGVSVDTVRHYERRGLIAPAARTAAGYRTFSPDAVRCIQEIRAALGLGFGLDELAAAFRARERGEAPCRSMRALLARKATELDRLIAELVERRARIATTLATWDRRLVATKDGEPARLFAAALEHASSPGAAPPRNPVRRRKDSR